MNTLSRTAEKSDLEARSWQKPAPASEAGIDSTLLGAIQSDRVLWAGVLLLALFGLGLRVVGASGDLWLDEIWTLDLLRRITSIDQVFWRINHDNNHYLNSAYLYLVGRDASPLMARALSIALGTAAIVAAAVFNLKHGKVAALVTAMLFAVSYPMVNYGSEARGYVGMVLCTILAVLFTERRQDGPRYGIALGFSILMGVLFHLTMMETVAVCGLWTLWVLWRRTGNVGQVWRETLSIFTPAVRFLLPLVVCIVFANAKFGYTIGGFQPFTMNDFATGYAGMIRHLFGIPDLLDAWLVIALACVAALIAARYDRSARGSLYVIGIIVLPAMMFAARLPNLEFPRYFLVPGTLLLLLAGGAIGNALAAGGVQRVVAALSLCALLAGNAWSLAQFFELGRGSYSPIVATMGSEGPATYGTGNDARLTRMMNYFAGRSSISLTHIKPDDWCSGRPTWIVVDNSDQPERVDVNTACGLSYKRVIETRHYALSGASWTLYRRLD